VSIVAVDIGNTETCIGFGEEDSWESFRFTTRTTITSDEWLMMMKTTLPDKKDELKGSIICSVVPQVNKVFIDALSKYTESSPLVLGPGVKTGLSVIIDNPKELGPDRIANSVGGFEKVGSPVIIVDLGTATTIDIVNKNKEYVGGVIAPGLKISLEALVNKTASLKSVDFTVPKEVIGKNTYDAIQSGVIFGHTSLIDGLIEKSLQELGEEASVIITGGFGSLIKDYLNIKVEFYENLTLDGLAKIYEINS